MLRDLEGDWDSERDREADLDFEGDAERDFDLEPDFERERDFLLDARDDALDDAREDPLDDTLDSASFSDPSKIINISYNFLKSIYIYIYKGRPTILLYILLLHFTLKKS